MTVQAGPLSYERLASLAGLERKGGTGAGTAAGAKGFVLPDEARLRRAEELVAAAEAGEWGAVVELAGSVRRGWWGDGRDAAVARGLLMQAAMSGGCWEAGGLVRGQGGARGGEGPEDGWAGAGKGMIAKCLDTRNECLVLLARCRLTGVGRAARSC